MNGVSSFFPVITMGPFRYFRHLTGITELRNYGCSFIFPHSRRCVKFISGNRGMVCVKKIGAVFPLLDAYAWSSPLAFRAIQRF
ncbi:MAG: hypothetical protein HPY52_14520 [Firmicutes bacterium]|nr:hypothetical protein [Bacillota bacterium]